VPLFNEPAGILAVGAAWLVEFHRITACQAFRTSAAACAMMALPAPRNVPTRLDTP
jgi:hypothetical protein